MASYSVVQTANNGAQGGASVSVTITSSTAGNLLVCTACCSTNTTIAFSDNKSQSWGTGYLVNSAAGTIAVGYFISTASGVTSVTVTAGTTTTLQVVVREYNTTPAITALDQTSTNTNTSANPVTSGTTGTTATANELLVGSIQFIKAFANPPQFTVGTGYSNYNESSFVGGGGVSYFVGIEDQLVTSTGTQSATFGNTNSDNANAGIMTFKLPNTSYPFRPAQLASVTIPSNPSTSEGVSNLAELIGSNYGSVNSR